ncbi:[Citrate [pro-3S]-lyase] ligase [Austwickia sp. TVS 96-490-7B]|uniref:[citrate (pro-3S)-lyase] ligase n=1 Tax=Austwickia sp. TVS 96-490-7B TaxID=2830843 RepID=UPI001C582F64|nr:[citrate (pro-3S)-lyase] ligase [Austwickia sp. TVS 96-490-7B]MBW3085012.1 [Citrate [pro-3S]-lyase] ligase [Austwickia sp. TVS 96-490-7B]
MDDIPLDEISYDTVIPTLQPGTMAQVRDLIAQQGLQVDSGIDVYCVARRQDRLVGCGGLSGDVIKCVSIDDAVQGQGVVEKLITELTYTAVDRGVHHLFLYTRPQYEQAFSGCGFHTIASVPDTVVMMENTASGVSTWTEQLTFYRRDRPKVGACVVNCNPFTLGHQYLLQQAAQDCDYLHVFVVSEDASFFPYRDRLALVRAGVATLPERDRIHVHPGSPYIVSKATFPTYFLKDEGIIDMAATAIDLRIFRQHIAPALGLTHRYVGTEPLCRVTRQYNADMRYWLEQASDSAPPVTVVEIPRLTSHDRAISATEVRRRILDGRLDGLRDLVPSATYALIIERYGDAHDKARATAEANSEASWSDPHVRESALAALERAFVGAPVA